MIMERKTLHAQPAPLSETTALRPQIKVMVLPASNAQVTVPAEDNDLSRSFAIKHRPRKGFSYDGPGGSYPGF
jgi:hypothetical protein